MAAWQAKPGETILIPSGPSGYHLFALLSGPCLLATYGQSPQVTLVSVCSIRAGLFHDSACELQAGQHPFVQHQSYLSYRHMRIESEMHLNQMTASGVWKVNTPLSAALLQQAIEGVCLSRLTSREFKRLFGCP